MNAKRPIRCAIYTRKSTEDGLEQEFNSLDAQREACEAYIASQKSEGWIALTNQYDDGGYSGGTLQRPALQRLLADIDAGSVDVVVVYKIDRLSRSLMDFAKIVEIFDRKTVTFVSVTQSFNTTTSMGRLTLNVLLSFAQFEREVTGERIRDKFAASKKKGMWMGGNPPLGYDIDSRKLVVNTAEAETVNLIFQRYLDLGSVRTLSADLISKGIVSKIWVSTSGTARGGKPFDRGALYCLLKNRVYVGDTMHKGVAYPGEHKAIVPLDLFDKVQEHLAASRRRQLGKPSAHQDALLAGLLFDEDNKPMTPTYSVKPGHRRYRYYASQSRLKGEPSKASISRVPAAPLEDIIMGALARLRLPPGGAGPNADTPSLLRRVTIKSHTIVIDLDRAGSFQWWRTQDPEARHASDGGILIGRRGQLAAGEELSDQSKSLRLVIPVRAQFRGGRAAMMAGTNDMTHISQPDTALIKALARAHRWKQMLIDGEVHSVAALSVRVGQERRHVGQTLGLAFLSPELTAAILKGEQPASLRLAHLLDADIPLSWGAQRAKFNKANSTMA